jgi:quinoprotein glucose dehydrogenase
MRLINRRLLMQAASSIALLGNVGAWAQTRGAAADTEWRHYANDLANTRYAPLDQIDGSNFNRLEVAWRFSTNSFGPRLDADYQSTPLCVKGRIFTTAGFRRDVVALDAVTGELLWMHRKDEGARIGSRGGAGFGLSYWTDGALERILYVTRGYQLISLDAATGLPDPAFGTKGVVELRENDDQVIDPEKGVIGLHAAPLVTKNVVVIGSAPTAAVKGYLRGFDVRSGQRKWIFHTVPQKGEFGYETWIGTGEAEAAGNTGVWANMSADEELGLLYAGVELPPTDILGISRQGQALFSESVVALDIETGERKWHYQMVHHGLWDQDVPCASILCEIPHDGRLVKALVQPSKQGFLYVLDRTNGKPLWPIPERSVLKGDVSGEWYSPTQPVPTRPPAYDRQGVTPDDLIDWTPAIKARALEIASHYRMGPLFTPPSLFKPEGPWGTLVLPGTQGGANWPGGSYDPESHIVYIFSKTRLEALTVEQDPREGSKIFALSGQLTLNTNEDGGGGFGGVASLTGGSGRRRSAINDKLDAPVVRGMLSIEGLPLNKPPFGRITAIDLNSGKIAWQVAHGETPDFIKNHPLLKGIKIPRTGQAGILGTLTTKSLVICGDSGLFTDEHGRKGARLRAYDKATGEEKGAVFLDKVQTGAAMTYMAGGQQYIVTAIGSSFGAELVAFRLPAKV